MKRLLLVLGMLFCTTSVVSAQGVKTDSVTISATYMTVHTGEEAFPYDVVYEDSRNGCRISWRSGANPGIEIVARWKADSQMVRVTSSSAKYAPRGSLARLMCRDLVHVIPDTVIKNNAVAALSM